jgi:WD40 repeat protein
LLRLAFVLEYTLVVPRDGAVERWTGPRRQPRAVAAVHAGELVEGHPVLLDRNGRVCVDLWPLAQVVSPAPDAAQELWLFDGRGASHERHDAVVWDWLAARVLPGAEGPEAGDERRPYLGLASYGASDAARFVGREAEVEGLLARLRQHPLQVVVGPSGAGKSSFVHAGVIPGLPAGWRAITLRPGSAPLAALASRLRDAGVATDDLGAQLATSPGTAAAQVADAAAGGTLVVVIDQLEELFTLCASSDERDRFAAAIAQLAASADLPLRVIATLRDDFLMRLDALPALRGRLSSALVLLGNPVRDDLVRIVVEPARRAGYALSDPELANDMVSAVASRPGALAVLSFAASRLWELRDRTFRQLTRSAYDAMGGVAGALVSHAEATFDGLAADEQRLAREIFRHLVTAEGARAALSAQELRQRLATPRAGEVLDKLVAARLIATSEAEGEAHTAGESQVEVIHDSLLDGWPRLQRWIREDVEGARMREQLRTAARQWSDRGRPGGLLWRDDALVDVVRWLGRSTTVALSDLEAAFVDASRRLARRARIRRTIGLVAVSVAIALAVPTYFWIRRAADQRVRQVYVDRGADALLAGKHTEALAYLAQAVRRGDDSPRVRFMLARAAYPLQGQLARLSSQHGRMWWAMFSQDGRQIVTTDDGGAQIWDARSMSLQVALPHGDTVYQAVFTPDGSRIATAGADGVVKVWDARTGELKASYRHAGQEGALPYAMVAVSPDGTKLAAVDVTGVAVHLWDLQTGRLIGELVNPGSGKGEPWLEFSRDGRWLATAAGSDTRVYDVETRRPVLSIPGLEAKTLSFDPTGSRLATGTLRGDVSIWTIPDGKRAQHLRETGDRVDHVAFSPDGAFVVAASREGTIRVWNARTGELQAELNNHHGAVLWAEFDPTSRLVVSADRDGTVAISDAALRMAVSTLEGPRGVSLAAHFDPSSRRVVAASWDGTARVWDATRSYLQWATLPIGDDCGQGVPAEPDRRFLAIGCTAHGTQVWDTAQHRLLAELPSPMRVPASTDFFSPSSVVDAAGDRAAIPTADDVAIYELPGRRIVGTVHHPAAVTTVAFAANGHDLVTGSLDGSLLVTRDGADPLALAHLPAAVDVAGILPDGRVVVADARPRLGVYDATRRVRLAELDLPSRISGFRESSDGRRLLAIPPTGAVHPIVLCDMEHYQIVAKLDAHKAVVFSAKFVDGDRQILSAGTDGTARLWDAATGRLEKTFPRSSTYLMDAALDPTGELVVTAGGDGLLRFWDVSSARMIWTLRSNDARAEGVHFEGDDVVTRGFTGEIARWTLPRLPAGPELARTVERALRCLPLRVDDDTGELVEQSSHCDL